MNNLIKRVWTRKELVFVEDLRGMAFTNEDGAHTFSIAGKDENGTDLALSGTVAGSLIRPDGTTTAMTGTIADGCANLTLSPECYGVSGRASLTIFLTSGGQKTAIYHAVMSIGKSSTSQVSPGVAADVVDLVNRIDTATASIPATYTALLGSIASDYSSSKTYKAGNYVWYGGYLYKANQDIDTAESWTSGHWTKAVLADDFRSEITDLKSAISDSQGNIIPSAELKNEFDNLYYDNGLSFKPSSAGRKYFYFPMPKNSIMVFTNNTGAGMTLYSIAPDGTETSLSQGLGNGKSYEFATGNNEYIGITGYFNSASGTFDVKYKYSDVNKVITSFINERIDGANRSFTIPDSGTFRFIVGLKKGFVYKWTFTGNSAHTFYYMNPDGTAGTSIGIINPSTPVTFSPNSDGYIGLRGYFNSSGSATLETIQTSDAKIAKLENISKNTVGFIYTTASARHSYTISNGEVIFTVGANLNARTLFKAGGLNWSTISTAISSKIVINQDNSAVITVTDNAALVYNFDDELLHIRNLYNNNGFVINDYPLIINSYGNPQGGQLFYEYFTRSIMDLLSSGLPTSSIIRRQTFNASYHDATGFSTKCQQFSNLLLGDVENNIPAIVDFESFLFFTDPHLLEGSSWQDQCYEFISIIQKYYNSTPTTFCVCGGDWLGNSDLPAEACFKMGYIDGFMHSMFNDCYMLVGNHDTNYQGKKDPSSATYTTKLSIQSIKNLWYRKGEPYYVFDGANTRFYCFDTNTEAQSMGEYDGYGWKQANWFANALLTDDSEHIALAAHIIYYAYDSSDTSTGIQPLSEWVLKIAQAYNNRTSIEVNGTAYNFTGRTGKVEFFIGGHYHTDINGILYGIPWVLTINVRKNVQDGPSFDLCIADYDNGLLKMVRVGNGSDRTISLSTGQIVQ